MRATYLLLILLQVVIPVSGSHVDSRTLLRRNIKKPSEQKPPPLTNLSAPSQSRGTASAGSSTGRRASPSGARKKDAAPADRGRKKIISESQRVRWAANARAAYTDEKKEAKRKYRSNMTDEQREKKRARDRNLSEEKREERRAKARERYARNKAASSKTPEASQKKGSGKLETDRPSPPKRPGSNRPKRQPLRELNTSSSSTSKATSSIEPSISTTSGESGKIPRAKQDNQGALRSSASTDSDPSRMRQMYRHFQEDGYP